MVVHAKPLRATAAATAIAAEAIVVEAIVVATAAGGAVEDDGADAVGMSSCA